MERESRWKVCVTGGAGYIGSHLVKKLLDKGYTVHATLRNLDDERKVGFMKSLVTNEEAKLELFEADIYSPNSFHQAIQGCHFVFHVATALQHSPGSQYKNRTEATVTAAKSIGTYCMRSGTVKRLIYTASVVSASPLKADIGSSACYLDFMDETCWTPLNVSVPFCDHNLKDYTESKTLTEKEILSYGKSAAGGELEVVTLACGLVGGDTLLSYTPTSISVTFSQFSDNKNHFQSLRYLEELLGKLPIVHIEDVCDAHIFCMEIPSIDGRFLCASSYISSAEIANYYQQHYPDLPIIQQSSDVPRREIKFSSTKLIEKGFEYKYNVSMILDDSIKCARRIGDIWK